ncbi:MAG: L,D-transpeptidase [Lachnospiraceae bacterium]|nr:L,D-transpeptidase [Lachnospiraceae bacterium]
MKLKLQRKQILAIIIVAAVVVLSIAAYVIASSLSREDEPAAVVTTGTDAAVSAATETDATETDATETDAETVLPEETTTEETTTIEETTAEETTAEETTVAETTAEETTVKETTTEAETTTKDTTKTTGTSAGTTVEESEKVTDFGYVSFNAEVLTKAQIKSSLSSAFIEVDYTPPADAEYPYLIKVNRAMCTVTIYGIDSNGDYSIPVKAMVCSVAKTVVGTPLGTFTLGTKYTFHLMKGGVYSQYATRIYQGIMFHAVPDYTKDKSNLEYLQFNKLGSPASAGCCRLCVLDAKWIQDNCPTGTTVIIYSDSSSAGPLGKPEMIKIPTNSKNRGWDPTDPDPLNPWNSCYPSIKIAGSSSTITVASGSTVTTAQLFDGVSATDTCGNDITDRVKINNIEVVSESGSTRTLKVTYYTVDLLGKEATATKTVIVTGVNEETTTTTPETTIKKTETTTQAETTTKKTETTTQAETTTTEAETTTAPEETTESGEETTTEEETTTGEGTNSHQVEEEISGEGFLYTED